MIKQHWILWSIPCKDPLESPRPHDPTILPGSVGSHGLRSWDRRSHCRYLAGWVGTGWDCGTTAIHWCIDVLMVPTLGIPRACSPVLCIQSWWLRLCKFHGQDWGYPSCQELFKKRGIRMEMSWELNGIAGSDMGFSVMNMWFIWDFVEEVDMI